SPTPPYGITVLECVRDAMVLAWKQPTFIGGADITGYFVDYREVIGGVPGKWHEANIKSVSERAYRVSELKENMLYQFQVRAANMAGVGIPSLPSETFKCEEWTIAVPELMFSKLFRSSSPVIPLKTELAVELLEKGRVRFWLQAEKISANGKVEYVFNDNVVHQGEKYKMNFDKNTGIIEMFMESLGKEDEGTFTFQLQDGKATNQSSLVLIGDVFKQLQKESEFQKKEWIRKQGPHFVEYLGYEVTPECCVRLKCKVANMKKDSVALWYKDGREIKVNEKLDFSEGVLTLEIVQISKKDAGIYEVVLKDDRGKDTSTLNLTDQ
ncbi:myomesin-1-like, partial [Sinocyclocheilus grahami]|uniref:myomesin-1-like n=1 Tax=Sinocyclocheilus grahami TaxID=75366 RepID=UPI0007AD0DF8